MLSAHYILCHIWMHCENRDSYSLFLFYCHTSTDGNKLYKYQFPSPSKLPRPNFLWWRKYVENFNLMLLSIITDSFMEKWFFMFSIRRTQFYFRFRFRGTFVYTTSYKSTLHRRLLCRSNMSTKLINKI
jgi:hypothetical protein